MNSEKNYVTEDIIFEAEMIPTYSDMEMLLSQEGIRLNGHIKESLSEIAAVPMPDETKIAELTKRLLSGDEEAKNELIEGLMRLVVCTAKRYCGRGVLFSDLIQEGSLGLVCAVGDYSASDGDIKSAAVRGIIEAVENAVVEEKNADDIPEELTRLLTTVSHSDMVLMERLGREATPEEIAEDSGLDTEKVAAVMEIMEDIAERDNEADKAKNDTDDESETETEKPPRFDFGKYTRS